MVHSCIFKGPVYQRWYTFCICKIVTNFQKWLKLTEEKTLITKAKCCAKTVIKNAGDGVNKVVETVKEEFSSASYIVNDKKNIFVRMVAQFFEGIYTMLSSPILLNYFLILLSIIIVAVLSIFLWKRGFYFSKYNLSQDLSTATLFKESSFLKNVTNPSNNNDASHIVKTANINFDITTPPTNQLTMQKSDLHFELQDQQRNKEIDESLTKKLNEAVEVVSQLDDITDWNFNLRRRNSSKNKSIESEVDYEERKTTAAIKHLTVNN
uniref:Uncharacterized protein n=1 Tax=Parastrongyloides trichosuri TaxID=131310 RepID=A0A0N4ZNX5_PARTI